MSCGAYTDEPTVQKPSGPRKVGMPLSAETPAPVSTVTRDAGSASSPARRGETLSGACLSDTIGQGALGAAPPAGAELAFQFLAAAAPPRRAGLMAAAQRRRDHLARELDAPVADPDLGPAFAGRQFAHGRPEVLVADEAADPDLLEEAADMAGHERVGRGIDA